MIKTFEYLFSVTFIFFIKAWKIYFIIFDIIFLATSLAFSTYVSFRITDEEVAILTSFVENGVAVCASNGTIVPRFAHEVWPVMQCQWSLADCSQATPTIGGPFKRPSASVGFGQVLRQFLQVVSGHQAHLEHGALLIRYLIHSVTDDQNVSLSTKQHLHNVKASMKLNDLPVLPVPQHCVLCTTRGRT